MTQVGPFNNKDICINAADIWKKDLVVPGRQYLYKAHCFPINIEPENKGNNERGSKTGKVGG